MRQLIHIRAGENNGKYRERRILNVYYVYVILITDITFIQTRQAITIREGESDIFLLSLNKSNIGNYTYRYMFYHVQFIVNSK